MLIIVCAEGLRRNICTVIRENGQMVEDWQKGQTMEELLCKDLCVVRVCKSILQVLDSVPIPFGIDSVL